MTKRIYIYRIYFPTPDKYYVGQTNNIKKRMSNHLIAGHAIHKALWKYDDWIIEILHTCKSRDEANRIEIEEIRHYNCIAPNGYNLTRGGDGIDGYQFSDESKKKMRQSHLGKKYGDGNKGYKHTEESKIKMKIARKGRTPAKDKSHVQTEETKRKISIANSGKKFSEEHRKKISIARQGTKVSEETKAKMSQSRLGKKNPMFGKRRDDVSDRNRNPRTIRQIQITKLKTKIAKLEDLR